MAQGPAGFDGFDEMGSLRRTHACGDVTSALVGSEVVLGGWVQGRRDHGGVIFVDLRGVGGIVQVVFRPDVSPECHQRAGELRSEYVILVRGRVERRSPETVNPKLPTRRGRGRGQRAAPAQHRDAAALRDRRRDARPTSRRACATASTTCGGPPLQRALRLRHRLYQSRARAR